MIYHFGNAEPVDFRTDQEQLESPLSLHRDDTQDLATAERMASEQIHTSGAWVNLYIRTDNGDINKVWDEDADPTYNQPVAIKCFFKPQPQQLELTRWGIDATSKTEAVFAISDLTAHWPGRMVRFGDVIELPYNHPVPFLDPGFYRIENAAPAGNFRYHWLYYTCNIEILTADITVRPTEDLPPLESQELFEE